MVEQRKAFIMVLHGWFLINTSLSSLFSSTSEYYALTTAKLCITNHCDFLQLLLLMFTKCEVSRSQLSERQIVLGENHHQAKQEFPV